MTAVDGWLYAIGGSDGTDSLKYAEQYDPLSNTWTVLPSMRLPRSYFGVSQLHGKIYSVGKYGIYDSKPIDSDESKLFPTIKIQTVMSTRLVR